MKPPGPPLDALVAERVMGKALCVCTNEDRFARRKKLSEEYAAAHLGGGFVTFSREIGTKFGSDGNCNDCGKHYVPSRRYSTEIAAAWEVVEKMRKTHYFRLHSGTGAAVDIPAWTVDIYPFAENRPYFGPKSVEATTAPHAICVAALLAVGWAE